MTTPPEASGTDQWSASALLGIVGTTAVILPAFLTGAVAVQIREDLGLTESAIGVAIGAFFAGSTLGSALLGRLAERIGPVAAIRLGLAVTIATDLAVAGLARSAGSLAGLLVVAGLANALTQPAINLLIVRRVGRHRLGLVMALKQSGMPAAALLGGLAVPAVALTIGWWAAYLMGALLAAGAGAMAATVGAAPQTHPVTGSGDRPARPGRAPEPSGRSESTGGPARPDQGWAVLLLMSAVGVLGGGAANIVVGYLVSGAVAAGVEPGTAGLVLTGGSALGIASRLAHGWLADRGTIDALNRVVILLGSGLAGGLILTSHRPAAYVVATPILFAGGWAWPGLFNLVVVQANRSAPAAATGVTQTGVYLGSILGPVVAGVLIERWGYGSAWALTGACLGGAALLALAVRMAMTGTAGRGVERRPATG